MDQVEAKAHTISEKAHQVISAKVSLAGDVKEAVIDKTIAGVEGVKEILAGTYFTSKKSKMEFLEISGTRPMCTIQ